MPKFLSCVIYLALAGIVGFVLGRILPKRWFRADRFPYRPFQFEQNGNLYLKLKIRKWQNRIPDMSKILPGTMPAKSLAAGYGAADLTRMIQETCVAEFIHVLLCVAGCFCVLLWKSWGGVIVAVLYILGNLPFVFVQRFNRPRLQRLLARCRWADRNRNGQEGKPCAY